MTATVAPDKKKQPKKKMRLAKRMFLDIPSFFNDLEFHPAANIDEQKQAAHLVYKEYLSRDYIQPNEQGLNFSMFQMLPSTVTFVAVHKKKRALGTVTLVADSQLQLPMDKIYADELNSLRAAGARLAEAGRLAVDEEAMATEEFHMSRSQRLLFLFSLYAALLTHFRDQRNLTQLVACFHPRHEFVYDFMGFGPLGGLKSYESVQGSPAVARSLVKRDILVQVVAEPEFQDVIFFWDRPAHTTAQFVMSRSEFSELFIEKSSVYQDATPEQRAFVSSMNPALNESTRKFYSLLTQVLQMPETGDFNMCRPS